MSRQSKMARKHAVKKQASVQRQQGNPGPHRTQKLNKKVNVWWKKGKNVINKKPQRDEEND